MAVEVTQFTYSEFLDYALNTERVESKIMKDVSKSSETGDEEFTGTDDFQQAIDYARHGWDAGIKELELEKEIIIAGQVETINHVVGSYVSVGDYLSGNPECMVQFVDRVERDMPELEVFVLLSYSAGKSSQNALLYAKKVLQIITKYSTDYRIKITGVFYSAQSDNIDSLELITIKDYDDNFVLNNIAFSFHPSFFRRFWFKFLETKDYRGLGYGTACTSQQKFEKAIDEYAPASTGKRMIFPTFQYKGVDSWREQDVKVS